MAAVNATDTGTPDTASHTLTATTIALAGNPNSGKTTLFNALTGLRYKVANYPGVTVEKKVGKINREILNGVQVIDLPGMYSLSGSSIDERIASNAILGTLKGEKQPTAIISVLDATNLERNLYLTTQLLDLGIPIVVALNMHDLAEKRGISIKREILSRILGVPVVPIVAQKKLGIDELLNATTAVLRNSQPKKFAWASDIYESLNTAQELGAKFSPIGVSDSVKILLGLDYLSDAREAPTDLAAITEAKNSLMSHGIDPQSFEATKRYAYINEIIKKSLVTNDDATRRTSEKIDVYLTHKIWGTLIFALIMGAIFQAIFLWAKIPMDFISHTVSDIGGFIGEHLPEGKIRSLIVDGIIAGVGSILVFIPQIAILFFFLSILEDTGYLSRAAFLMDKLMRKVGLQGRAFIPLLSSFACAIPGILSTRTIPSFADRLVTILVAPLMSCSARLPVYALLIAACIPAVSLYGIFSLQGTVLLSMYILGVLGAAGVAWLLRLFVFRGAPAIFVMEMPPLRLPSLTLAVRQALDRIVVFIKSAGSVILACSVLLWFLATFPEGGIQNSFAGRIGAFIEPVIKPLGFSWEIGIGILASFAAREVFVSTLATVYNIQQGSASGTSLVDVLHQKHLAGGFSIATAVSLMVFYVFCCQCMSTLAVCKRETGSIRWTAFMFIYMTTLAYIMAYISYHLVQFMGA